MIKETQAQAVADQIDCDLDRLVRRCQSQAMRDPQAKKLWNRVALVIESVRGDVRTRMHEEARKATQ